MEYFAHVLEDSKFAYGYGAIVILAVFLILGQDGSQAKFIAILFTAVVLIFYYQYSKGVIDKRLTTINNFTEHEKDIKETQYQVDNVYDVLQKPSKIKYLYLEEQVMAIMNHLSFIKTFDAYGYDRLVVLLENFFRIYYKVLVESLDAVQYAPVLTDLRLEILNHMSEFYYSVPQFSKNVNGNIYEIIDTSMRKIHSILQKALKIVRNKIKKDRGLDVECKAPLSHDPTKTQHSLY
jgi:hypothetical protein